MSNWTHAICIEDWDKLNPDRQWPKDRPRRNDELMGSCCWCGGPFQGIFLRHDPTDPILLCNSESAIHRESNDG